MLSVFRLLAGVVLLPVAAAAMSMLATGCGGGGGGSGSTPRVLPLPSGALEGTVEFIQTFNPIAIEREPNDTVDTAHNVADAYPGDTRSLFGRLNEADGDIFDAFRMRFPHRTTIHASLITGPTNNIQLAIYDPASMQFIGQADPTTNELVFSYQGVVDFVVTTPDDAGSYEVRLTLSALTGDVPEFEPNNDTASADPHGTIVLNEPAAFGGRVDDATDVVDMFLVSIADDGELDLTLVIPSFADFSARISDATSDLHNAVELLTLDAPDDSARQGTLGVSAGTLLLIEIRADAGDGPWRLLANLRTQGSTKPGHAVPSVRAPYPLVAPASIESRRVQASAIAPYGRFLTDAAPGEALLCFTDREHEGGQAQLATRGCTVITDTPGAFCRVRFEPSGFTDDERRRSTYAKCSQLACSRCVAYAEPNFKRTLLIDEPDDPFYPRQRWNMEMIGMPRVWSFTQGDSSVLISILDSGIVSLGNDGVQSSDILLNTDWASSRDFVSDATSAGDGDGIDADPSDRSPFAYGHGTFVASIAGARGDDATGMAGVSWYSSIAHVRVGGNSMLDSDIAQGILYAARLPNASGTLPRTKASVINMSIGGLAQSRTLESACLQANGAGVTLICAAGNFGTNTPVYPAAFPSTISVSAVGGSRDIAPYSSFGPTVTLAAPGGDGTKDFDGDGFNDDVLGLGVQWKVVGGSREPFLEYKGGSGTSAAAPHVAGAVALMILANRSLTPAQVQAALTSTARDIGAAGRDDFYGHGLLDVYRAIAEVAAPGYVPASPAELVVAPSALSIRAGINEISALIHNAGTDFLDVTSIDVETEDGGDWIEVELVPSTSADANASEFIVRVDRVGLAATSHFAVVTLRSNGGDVDVPVVLRAPGNRAPPNIEIHIQAVDVETGNVVREAFVNPTRTLDFSFPSIPIGTYVIVAGSDIDGDGEICEAGDYCGGYPIATSLEPITVLANIATTGLRFDAKRDEGAP